MCENKNGAVNVGLGFAAGTLVGALIGVAAALLLTPSTGVENRKKLGIKAKELSDKGGALVEDAKVASAPYLREVEQKIAPILQNAKRAGGNVEADVNEKIQQLVSEAALEEEIEDTGVAKKPQTKTQKKYFKGTKS